MNMFFQGSFLVMIFVMCSILHAASFTLEEEIKNIFLAKYRLLQSPKNAVMTICKNPRGKKTYFNCDVNYEWRQNGIYENVCKTPSKSFGPRYYKVVLQCYLGKIPIGALRSEWEVFY